MTRQSASRECARCGTWATTVMLPTGPICYRCRRDIAYYPAVCPECFELRPVAYPSTSSYNVLVCAGCADEDSVFACTQCGREDHPYGADRCARCILTERLTELLTDSVTGLVHERLRPVFDELAAASRPQSVITWLQKPPATGKRLLGLMARGEMPITHDAFRELPSDRSHNYLRELLTATGILPAYAAPLERIDRWLAGKLAPLDADTAALIGRFARWHVLRRMHRNAEHGEITKGATDSARAQINGAIRIAQWAHRNGTTLPMLTQTQLEHYLAEHPGGRTGQYGFIAWLRSSRTNKAIRLMVAPNTLPEIIVSDADRWASVDALLHDTTIRLYARIGGLFMLLFAQPLMDICAMTTNQITLTDDARVLVTFDATPVQMPPILDALIRQHLDRPGVPSIASGDHGWLFPGRNPGRHLATENFRKELVDHGIHPARSRHAALFSLAGALPAPVLIGIADTTATRWAALAARDWSSYIAAR